MPGVGECRSCGAPVRWAITSSGKRMPLDPQPSARGNIVLRPRFTGQSPLAEVYRDHTDALAAVEGSGDTYTTHFETCPQAASHRRR